jgi:peptide/nickel transport system substrate-binding protein
MRRGKKVIKKLVFITLLLVLVVFPAATACSQSTTSSTTSTTKPVTSTTAAPTATTSQPQTTTPSTAPASTTTSQPPSTTAAAKWWEAKWGQPQYGGTLTVRTDFMGGAFFDPASPMSIPFMAWSEPLFFPDPTVDRNTWSFQAQFTPSQYMAGWIAQSWEQADPTTITVHIRQGVTWQDKPPVNGREFTADDVQYSWDRILGTGSGFTTPNPFYPSFVPNIKQVVAIDKYTVNFKLSTPQPLAVFQILGPNFVYPYFTAPEWMALSPGAQNDMKNAIGTGAFMLSDIVQGTSITFVKNPKYWGHDMRNPNNQLPYIDTLQVVVIPDNSTMLAALRTAKIDSVLLGMTNPTIQQATSLAQTNPEIQTVWGPAMGGPGGVSFKYGAKPFDDIRVRQAMQLAVNMKEIAQSHYLGKASSTPTGMASSLLGSDWAVPFDQLPADLQAQYTYDVGKARQLMLAAGFPNGFETNCIASNVDDSNLLQILKSEFADIGINMSINVMDRQTYQNFRMNKKHDQMDVGVPGPSGTGTPSLSNLSMTNPAMNTNGVNDAHYEELVTQFNSASTMAQAQQVFKSASQYFLEQHWGVQAVGGSQSAKVWQPWVKGYTGEYAGGIWTYAWYSMMWVDKSLKK